MLSFLQVRDPFAENCPFNRADKTTSVTVGAPAVVDINISRAFGIQLAFGPVNAFLRAERDTVADPFANVADDGVGHGGHLQCANELRDDASMVRCVVAGKAAFLRSPGPPDDFLLPKAPGQPARHGQALSKQGYWRARPAA
jgi:hypothetical protein